MHLLSYAGCQPYLCRDCVEMRAHRQQQLWKKGGVAELKRCAHGLQPWAGICEFRGPSTSLKPRSLWGEEEEVSRRQALSEDEFILFVATVLSAFAPPRTSCEAVCLVSRLWLPFLTIGLARPRSLASASVPCFFIRHDPSLLLLHFRCSSLLAFAQQLSFVRHCARPRSFASIASLYSAQG